MEFIKKIQIDTLPKKKYMVIKYVLDHPDEVILMNTSDLAKKLKVDPVTIIKTCQEVGLQGFHDLKKRLKVHVNKTKNQSPFLNEFEVNTSTEEAIKNALTRDVEMLSRTMEKVSFEKITDACNAIIGSRHTFVIGLGYVGTIANYLQSLLRTHLPQVQSITEYNGMLFDCMGLFTKDDVVLAIGFDKCQNQTIKAFKKAKEKGATTIALTDSEYSPLCKYSQHDLLVYTAPNYFLSPLIGAFSICNALLHGVVELGKPHSTKRASAYNKLIKEENVYFQ